MPAAPKPATPDAIAGAFAGLLFADLSPVEWANMRVRNAAYARQGSMACASHDVRDSNMTMLDAFEALTLERPVGSFDVNPDGTAVDPAEEARCDAHNALWNEAWAIAKRDYLTETASLDDLSEVFSDWTQAEGLGDTGDALELLATDVTAEQRQWLTRFIARWDAVEDAADLAHAVQTHGDR